VQRNDVINFAD